MQSFVFISTNSTSSLPVTPNFSSQFPSCRTTLYLCMCTAHCTFTCLGLCRWRFDMWTITLYYNHTYMYLGESVLKKHKTLYKVLMPSIITSIKIFVLVRHRCEYVVERLIRHEAKLSALLGQTTSEFNNSLVYEGKRWFVAHNLLIYYHFSTCTWWLLADN